jgi:hypothetical protein
VKIVFLPCELQALNSFSIIITADAQILNINIPVLLYVAGLIDYFVILKLILEEKFGQRLIFISSISELITT